MIKNMKMKTALSEIVNALSNDAPLSLNTKMCAIVAMQEYIENHGENIDLTFNIDLNLE
jgi:hypothetical protein